MTNARINLTPVMIGGELSLHMLDENTPIIEDLTHAALRRETVKCGGNIPGMPLGWYRVLRVEIDSDRGMFKAEVRWVGTERA